MKECREIEKNELQTLMQEFNNIYDVVRLVEPEETTVVTIVEDHLERAQQEPCFAVWEKDARCENCISRRACREKQRMTKFEFREEEVYSVVSMPLHLNMNGKKYLIALELVNKVSNDLYIFTEGNGKHVEQLMQANQLLYEDMLTGVYNKRYFDEKLFMLEMTCAIPKRIGFLVVDINHFSWINDQFGYKCGDEVLKMISLTLKNSIRQTDKMMRIGGDEFVIVLRDCYLGFIEKKIEELKKNVRNIRMELMGKSRLSISVGMAYTEAFDGSKEQIQELWNQADHKMNKEKKVWYIQNQYSDWEEEQDYRKALLIVDDLEMNRRLLKMSFKSEYEIYEASNGMDALQIIKEKHIDMLITDIFMYKMDGYELMKHVRETWNKYELPIIAITENDEASQKKALEVGANAFIVRPFNGQNLQKSIYKLTGKDYGRDELIDMNHILNSMTGAIIVYKLMPDRTEIQYCSRGIQELLGWNVEEFYEMIHEDIHKGVYAEDIPLLDQAFVKARDMNTDVDANYRVYHKDGSIIWIWMQGHVIGHEDGCPIIEVILLDISQQKKFEKTQQELIRTKAANEAKSLFLSTVSHDMRTPLNTIINLAALAHDDVEEPKKMLDDLGKIEMAGTFLLGLINDVLDMSKIESGRMTLHQSVYHYQDFINYVDSIIVPLCIEKNLKFEWEKGDTKLDVWVDVTRFNQLFFNLLSNSVKYTEAGGTVTFGVKNTVIDNGFLKCDFIVADTGIGMTAAFQKKLFQPFERENSDEAYTGTGLGMTIAKKIVDLMNGTITVTSKKNVGTKILIHLDLPIATQEQVGIEEKAQRELFLAEKKENIGQGKILIVEDHPLNREVIMRLLQKKGYEYDYAPDGQKAVEIMTSCKPWEYQAILMDIRMPVMDGLKATAAIRKLPSAYAKHVPIIAMTANAYDEDTKISLEVGMNVHLSKPIIPTLLYQTLATFCRKKD